MELNPEITAAKGGKLKYSDHQLEYLKHPDWKHEVIGQIKGQNVVKISRTSHPAYAPPTHFHVVDPKTNDIHIQLQTHVSPSKPYTHKIDWLEARQSPVKAHDLYDFLLRKGHVKQFETNEQSPGGYRVWQKLAKRRNINVYGLQDNGYDEKDGRKFKPVNVDLSHTNDYLEQGEHKGLPGRIRDDADSIPIPKSGISLQLDKLFDKYSAEAKHEYDKRHVDLYASYHKHVLREHIIKLRKERGYLK